MYSPCLATIVELLRCSTRIHKILCSKLSIIIHGMILDRSLTAKLSRMTHSCRANPSSVRTLDGRDADTAVCKKKKTAETVSMWILIITAAGSNGQQAYGKSLLLLFTLTNNYTYPSITSTFHTLRKSRLFK